MSLGKYLENMWEIGGDPRIFVKYTQEHGSFIGRTASLLQEEQKHERNLQSLNEGEEFARNETKRSLSAKSELEGQINEQKVKLLAIREETEEVQQSARALKKTRISYGLTDYCTGS